MSLEAAIEKLAAAIVQLAETQGGTAAPKATRGKTAAPKDATPAADLSAQGTVTTEEAPKETTAPAEKPAEKVTPPGVTKTDVQQSVVKLVTALGRDQAAVVLQPYGAANVSGLDPAHYAAVKATADKMVADAKAAAEVAG